MTSDSTAEEGGAPGVAAPRARVLPPAGVPHALWVGVTGAPSASATEEAGGPHRLWVAGSGRPPGASGEEDGAPGAPSASAPGEGGPAAARPGSSDPGRRRPILVVGLGNPLLGDDAVGWRVVEELERRLGSTGPPPEADGREIETDVLAVGGIGLMERLAGASRAILVDAIETGTVPPGTVGCRRLSEIPIRAATHLDGTHDMPLPAALAAGRALGAEIPDDILVVAIEACRTDVFSADLSPAVAAAVPRAVQAILTSIAAG
jgi:hydrogenase maturation protease